MEDGEFTAEEDKPPSSGETRQLLMRFQARDDEAAAELLQRFSRELHAIAVQHMRGERVNHTLQPTALVNEAYIRLVGLDQMDWQGKAHFLGMAARTMRRVLVDHARKKKAQKRGSGVTLLSLQDSDGCIDQTDAFDLLSLDEASWDRELAEVLALEKRRREAEGEENLAEFAEWLIRQILEEEPVGARKRSR